MNPAWRRAASRAFPRSSGERRRCSATESIFAAVTRPLPRRGALLSESDARRETEELLVQYVVLHPNDDLVRTAIRGRATYQLSWFDAHMWAYAEHYGLEEIISEDFENGRRYGTVIVRNPFVPARSQ